jgi:hypothetical protein
MILELYSYSA